MSLSLSLHKAVLERNHDLLLQLLLGGIDANVENSEKRTPLHDAADLGDTEAVGLLIRHGAKVNMLDWMGYSPLALAVTHGHISVIELLLENFGGRNWANSSGKTLIHLAVESPNPDMAVIRMLQDAGVPLGREDESGWTALDYAIDQKSNNLVRELLQIGALNCEGKATILNFAVCVSNLEVVKLLVEEYDADPCAYYEEWAEWVDREPSEYSESLLHKAATRGDVEIVKFLLSKGADPNALNSIGFPPIVLSMSNLSDKYAAPVVTALLEGGADVRLIPDRASPRIRNLLGPYGEI